MRTKHAHTMQTQPTRARRSKKAANLSIDSELLDRAKRLKLNLSKVLEAGLAESIRQHEREQWLEKNRAALDAYNEHIEKHGVFSDGMRSF
jgi:antitoxin CcdA